MPEVAYLADVDVAARQRVTPQLKYEVKAAVDSEGFWQDDGEWRISTYLTRRVETVERNGRRWFEVTVTSDNEMQCHAPTLERALEFMFVFEQLVMDLFWTLGWPSWADRRESQPGEQDTLP
jgi:hypothetical protein